MNCISDANLGFFSIGRDLTIKEKIAALPHPETRLSSLLQITDSILMPDDVATYKAELLAMLGDALLIATEHNDIVSISFALGYKGRLWN